MRPTTPVLVAAFAGALLAGLAPSVRAQTTDESGGIVDEPPPPAADAPQTAADTPETVEGPPSPADTMRVPPSVLPQATVKDVEAEGRLFHHGIPVTAGSFSPEGFYFVYLFHVPGGFLSRKPVRCAFLLDLENGETRAIPTPKGRAARICGWDATGRYVLLESHRPDLLSSLTGSWTTYHYIYDVVTSEFVPRRPFTGRRNGSPFRWKHRKTYHGFWSEEQDPATVWPLYDGELADSYQLQGTHLEEEDDRRIALAREIAVGSGVRTLRPLGEVLPRLDDRWTQRGQRDPVVSELFGERPAVYARSDGEWIEVARETEHLAILDHGLVLITREGGDQILFHRDQWELLPLPPSPKGFGELLDTRWDRGSGYYDASDPLPRDLQYRRGYEASRGVASYFNYVSPDVDRALVLYWFRPDRRVLRIVDLPPSWRRREEGL
jgi:hypothetical protein